MADNDLDELTNLLDTLNNQSYSEDQSSSKTRELSALQSENIKSVQNAKLNNKSEIHDGDTDSSDDEDNKCAANQKYTETGRSIKNALKKNDNHVFSYFKSQTWKTNLPNHQTPNQTALAAVKNEAKDVYSDPYFGIRIITPLISSQGLKEKMAGRTPVTFSKLEKHLQTYDKSSDWVLAGAIVSKFIKTSQKGNPYACWTLSDLRQGLKTVSVFLFGKAYKNLWKTSTHVVVAILNATPLENRKSSGDIAALSVLNSDQVMIWGQSKDLGVCKARKKNGEPCTAFVNINQCEFCVYHVKQEYRKFSARSELQASSGGSLTQLRNKVIGKHEVFYAGKSYTAVPGKPTKKQVKKDQMRLCQLFNKCESRFGPESLLMSKPTKQAPSARVQLMKDAERLQKLTGSPATLTSLTLEGVQDKSRGLIKNKQHSKSECSENVLMKNTKYFVDPESNSLHHKTQSSQELNNYIKVLKNEGTTKLKELKIAPELQLKKKKDSEKINSMINSSKTKSCDERHNISSDEKKQPTKHRFENLVKIQSARNKVSKSNPCSSKSTHMYDVTFDFDDPRENSVLSNNDTLLTNTLKKQCNSTTTKTLAKKQPEEIIKGPLKKNMVLCGETINPLELVSSAKKKSNQTFTQKPPAYPLCEKHSPTKVESKLNIISHKLGQTSNKLIGDNELKNGEPDNGKNSPEFLSKRLQDLVHTNSPKLGKFNSLSVAVPRRSTNAKINALKYVRINGPIKPEDGKIKPSKDVSLQGEKRKRLDDKNATNGEKPVLSKRFLDLMNTTSKHLDLISNAENELIDEYYEKMEKKEKMEEKMLTTYKMDCKAYKCLKCKYKWFSASELCKAENHPIKVISAVKRFFQCHNCKNRTVSLEIIPLHNCANCGKATWERAPMMRERKPTTVHLSIRGGEQRFVNSVETNTNLDLLVPD